MRLPILTVVVLLLAGCASSEEPPAGTTPVTPTSTTPPAASTPASTTLPTPPGFPSTTPVSTPPATSPPPATTTPPPAEPTPATPPPLSISTRVRFGDLRYEPSELVVASGATVRFENDHVLTHTATSETGVWDSGNLPPGSPEFEVILTTPGKYPFYCKIHPEMRGNVTVIEVEETPPTPPTSEPEDDPSTFEATIFDFDFRPREPEVASGTTVMWTNIGNRAHTVTSTTGAFDSGNIAPSGGTYSFEFTTPGTYEFYCKIHPSMESAISVT